MIKNYNPQKNSVVVGYHRKQPKRKLFWVYVGSVASFFFLILGFLYLLSHADWFHVKSISVQGTRLASEERVLSSLEVDGVKDSLWRAWLGPEHILFWFFRNTLVTLSSSPMIKNIVLQTSFIKRSVLIKVEERNIKSVVCKEKNEMCFGMDSSGFVFTKTPNVEGALILKINDGSARPIVMGSFYMKNTDWMKNVIDILSVLKKYKFSPTSVVIDNLDLEEWRAILPSGLQFYFSLRSVPENLEAILKDILERAKLDSLSYFDFRVPNRIYYR